MKRLSYFTLGVCMIFSVLLGMLLPEVQQSAGRAVSAAGKETVVSPAAREGETIRIKEQALSLTGTSLSRAGNAQEQRTFIRKGAASLSVCLSFLLALTAAAAFGVRLFFLPSAKKKAAQPKTKVHAAAERKAVCKKVLSAA